MSPDKERLGKRRVEVVVPPKEGEKTPSTVVVYAGTSPRRTSFVRYIFEPLGYKVVTYPGGDEADIDDVVSIAKEKIRYARQVLKEEGAIKARDRVVYIASDVKTRAHIVDPRTGNVANMSYGKPRRPDQVMTLFGQMALASRRSTANPHYMINAGSATHVEQGQKQITSPRLENTTLIELDPRKVDWLAQERGFRVYASEFADYYTSPQYSNDGAHPPMSLTDLSAGFSIPVLTRLDAVSAINGISRRDGRFRDTFKKAVYQAGVGIQPGTLSSLVPDIAGAGVKPGELRPLVPDIDEKIDSWPWLEGVAAKALREDEIIA